LTGLDAATAPASLNSEGIAGTFTYTYTGDCLSSGSLASLGLNNNYYQYYSSALSAGTWAYASAGQTITYVAAAIPIG